MKKIYLKALFLISIFAVVSFSFAADPIASRNNSSPWPWQVMPSRKNLSESQEVLVYSFWPVAEKSLGIVGIAGSINMNLGNTTIVKALMPA